MGWQSTCSLICRRTDLPIKDIFLLTMLLVFPIVLLLQPDGTVGSGPRYQILLHVFVLHAIVAFPCVF